jgi:hypothetical protein
MEKKTEIPGLYKDESSGALINKNNEALHQYKKHKERDRKMKELEARIKRLEQIILNDKENQ